MGNTMKRKKGFYSISAVAEMFSVHQQTIRLYEKEGLIAPKRSEGNTRLFSEEDVDRLEEVIYLTHQLGINLAGVEMILKLKKQIKKMQKDMNRMFESTQEELSKEVAQSEAVAKESAQQLVRIKKEQSSTTPIARAKSSLGLLIDKKSSPAAEEQTSVWDIEYEDND